MNPYSDTTIERMDRALRPNKRREHWRTGEGSKPIQWVKPDVKYPDVTVQLTGEDGNAFFIVSRVRSAIERHLREEHGYSSVVARGIGDGFMDDALSGDYNHVVQTCMKWVTVR